MCSTATVSAAAAPAWDHLSFPYGYNQPLKQLNDVAAVSGTEAWAVGQSRFDKPPVTGTCGNVFRWDGRKWTQQGLIDTCKGPLHAVSAASSTSVWTVASTAAYRWDGQKWTSKPYPTESGNEFYLNDIAAVGNTAFAVGRSWRPQGEVTTAGVIRWDGNAWQKMSVPLPAGNTELTSVYATSANDVWAVGTTKQRGFGSDDQALVLHWNGSAWTAVPNPPKVNLVATRLNTVVARGGEAWVGGEKVTYESNGISVKTREALLARWDGRAWTATATPLPVDQDEKSVVLTLNGTEVWAGANVYDRAQGYKWIGSLLRWDGSAWQQTSKPALVEFGYRQLGSIPGGGLWAAGNGTRENDELAHGEYLARLSGS
ncbi:hypothetical protein ALI144C_41820 [Actinosynnema sp. ALI-1.44]|uniref:hypothetical protein n=1 Tax=Actinosynnema sp. ALI-1.44 TaxID=1933779 RepID=UPI00097C5242|nr:hypothetical protein [Actinosynnema sp. ALI-1.44]ONI75270.1 hypothetical protein ALI144C_41820 [Actinosynnema sp. ALI-1.44]